MKLISAWTRKEHKDWRYDSSEHSAGEKLLQRGALALALEQEIWSSEYSAGEELFYIARRRLAKRFQAVNIVRGELFYVARGRLKKSVKEKNIQEIRR